MERVLKIVFIILIMFLVGISIYLLLTSKGVLKNNIISNESKSNIVDNNINNENNINNDISFNNKYPKFRGTVEEINTTSMIVKPIEEEDIRILGDKVFINLGKDNDMLYFEGEELLITYTGNVRETYPVQIDVINIEVEYEYRTKIEDLPEEYVLEDAIIDNCVINVHGNEIYNKSEFDRFIDNVNNDIPDFVRIINYTIEGDMIITDIRFEGSNSFRVCKDNTRDKFSITEDRTYKEYRYSELEIEDDNGAKMYYLEKPIEGNLDKLYILSFEKDVKIIE